MGGEATSSAVPSVREPAVAVARRPTERQARVGLSRIRRLAVDAHAVAAGGLVDGVATPPGLGILLAGADGEHDARPLARADDDVLRLPVVHAHRLARLQDADVDPDLGELGLALEPADRRSTLDVAPSRLARIDD